MTRPGKHARYPRSPFGPTAARPSDARDAPPAVHPSGRWQFGLPALLGTMLLLCLPFALWGAILRANPNEELALTLLCIALPLGVLILAAVFFSLSRLVGKLRRRQSADLTEEE